MTDQYPQNFEIEIDRGALNKFLRVKWLMSWIPWFFMPVFFIGTLIVTLAFEKFEPHGMLEVIIIFVNGAGIGLLFSGIFVIPAYCVFIHFMAGNVSKSLTVTVEGTFLHIVQENYTRVDRKLHFRCIVDYTAVESRTMRRFGIMALHMNTTGGAIEIEGIKDCLKIRDMLAEIDSIRENE